MSSIASALPSALPSARSRGRARRSSRPIVAAASFRASAPVSSRRVGVASRARARASTLASRAAVDVVDVAEDAEDAEDGTEGDAAASSASIDDDDLPFDLEQYNAVVKLLVTFMEPDWVNPWQTKTAQRSTGSGAVISREVTGTASSADASAGGGGLILTLSLIHI